MIDFWFFKHLPIPPRAEVKIVQTRIHEDDIGSFIEDLDKDVEKLRYRISGNNEQSS